jgi:hypothetical protein
MSLYLITGLVLIVLPSAFNLLFLMLGRAFEYPDILRKPTDYILTRFVAGGRSLIALWYGFAATALLAIPMAFLLGAVFEAQQPQLAAVSVILGVLSGLTQAMGLLRWSLFVPMLAAQYTAPESTQTQRDALSVVFSAIHQYAGVVIGEHLGFLFTGAWTIVIGVMMIGSPLFSPILGAVGILSAIGILSGLLEPAGWRPAGMINSISYIVWSLWLIVTGITLIVGAF